MTFRVGQKVVCIKYDCSADEPWPRAVVGEVYTICKILNDEEGDLCLQLIELPCEATEEYNDCFWAENFRPIVERKTDISAFHEILRKVSHKEAVRA